MFNFDGAHSPAVIVQDEVTFTDAQIDRYYAFIGEHADNHTWSQLRRIMQLYCLTYPESATRMRSRIETVEAARDGRPNKKLDDDVPEAVVEWFFLLGHWCGAHLSDELNEQLNAELAECFAKHGDSKIGKLARMISNARQGDMEAGLQDN